MNNLSINTLLRNKKCTGTALLTTLIMVVIIMLLVATSLHQTITREKIAANYQRKNLTFQAAQSAVDEVVTAIRSDTDQGREIIQRARLAGSAGIELTEIANFDPNGRVSSGYQVRYIDNIGISGGDSVDADESGITIPGGRYEIIGEGSLSTGVETETKIFQGINYY